MKYVKLINIFWTKLISSAGISLELENKKVDQQKGIILPLPMMEYYQASLIY